MTVSVADRLPGALGPLVVFKPLVHCIPDQIRRKCYSYVFFGQGVQYVMLVTPNPVLTKFQVQIHVVQKYIYQKDGDKNAIKLLDMLNV